MGDERRALLTSTSNTFEARVIQARLQAEGLDPELRGAVDGPYPVNVGALGEVTLYVPEEQLEDARLVLLSVEVEEAVGTEQRGPRTTPLRPAEWLGIAAVLLAVLVLVATRVVA